MADLTRLVQHGDQVIVIAEAGVNHNGDLRVAHDLVDAAALSGASYVKFQTFDPQKVVAPRTAATAYQQQRAGLSDQTQLLKSLALPDRAWPYLRERATEAGIGFLSTPFDMESARLLVDLGVDALKVPSGELTNLPFLRQLARLGVPLLISTGMGDVGEVMAAANACSEAPSLAFFHCVSAYPARNEECNLRAIPSLAEVTRAPVGWSDHTLGVASALLAVGLGARLFEKHFTLDRSMDGPDHAASLEPDELSEYVQLLTSAPIVLGDGRKRRMPSEEENAPLVRRSWHAVRDLPGGTLLTDADLVALRPEAGISPSVDLSGALLLAAVRAGEAITSDLVRLPR